MKVVKNIKTGRLVYREQPDFKPGYGIPNALIFGVDPKDELVEVDATESQWQAEIALRQKEKPPALQPQIDEIRQRLTTLEKHDY